ncbi:RNA-directed DNA polymerase, eukaryota [Tanacetum coccineum]
MESLKVVLYGGFELWIRQHTEVQLMQPEPALVLGDECLVSKEMSKALFGRVKEFASLANLSVASWFSQIIEASLDFTVEGRIAWVEVEGIPFKLWSGNSFSRIASKWGKLLDVDDQEDSCFHSKRLCIHTKSGNNIREEFKVIHRGKVFWIRANETQGWVPDFNDELDDEEDQDDIKSNDDTSDLHKMDSTGDNSEGEEVPDTIFEDDEVVKSRCRDREFGGGGAFYGFGTCFFCKNNATISDYFVITRGQWRLTRQNMMVIVVYAPQENREKQSLWEYLQQVISKWKGEVIVMGDFNEIRFKSDRFGCNFNPLDAQRFNAFISGSGLVEIALGGSHFTWCHKSATKMSKLDRFFGPVGKCLSAFPNINAITLERFLSDHRPILLRENHYDYGPTPFRFYHHWLEIDGFSKLVEDIWKDSPCVGSNAMAILMGKLRCLKKRIRIWNKSNWRAHK